MTRDADVLGRRFGQAAAAYERGRPAYPAEAVRWMLGEPSLRVADVGAGTGKLTAAVVALGHDVVAVDPDDDMLVALAGRGLGVPTLRGTAERLPLADRSVDAVVLGQAWHWVDPIAASAEVGRVLAQGGVLGLVWNVRDESVPWVERLGRAMGASKAESMISADDVTVAPPFGELAHSQWRWEALVDAETVRAMARSRSIYLAAPTPERARIDHDLDEVIAGLGLAEGDTIGLPYVTHAFTARREG